MNILVTGARGFVGKNLVAALRNIRDGKDRTHPELDIREIFEYDTDGSPEQLADYAKSADFVIPALWKYCLPHCKTRATATP